MLFRSPALAEGIAHTSQRCDVKHRGYQELPGEARKQGEKSRQTCLIKPEQKNKQAWATNQIFNIFIVHTSNKGRENKLCFIGLVYCSSDSTKFAPQTKHLNISGSNQTRLHSADRSNSTDMKTRPLRQITFFHISNYIYSLF